jgi:hypothetical protein
MLCKEEEKKRRNSVSVKSVSTIILSSLLDHKDSHSLQTSIQRLTNKKNGAFAIGSEVNFKLCLIATAKIHFRIFNCMKSTFLRSFDNVFSVLLQNKKIYRLVCITEVVISCFLCHNIYNK